MISSKLQPLCQTRPQSYICWKYLFPVDCLQRYALLRFRFLRPQRELKMC